MNQKIERWCDLLRWLSAFLLAFLTYFFRFKEYEHKFYPWLIAGRATIDGALREFGGHGFMGIPPVYRYHVLADLVIGFVIVPTIFFFAWRKMQVRRGSPSLAATLVFVITGALTLTCFAPSIPAAMQLHKISLEMQRNGAIKAHKDDLMYDLGKLSFHAQAYWILPVSKHGGNNSFVAYTIPEHLKNSEGCRFDITSKSVDRIRFRGTSTRYPGSSISAEIVGAGQIRLFDFRGVF